MILQCHQLLRATPDEPWSLCAKRGLCFHCLCKDHLAKRCSLKKTCGEADCTVKHHRLLHQPGTRESFTPPVRVQTIMDDCYGREDSKTPDHAVLLAKSTTRNNILLQTVNARV
ncbi:hypothetical protein T4B_8143 [Trichinella pseudospiralis]|uniref:Uncharacterized protein n=2 Tax=Trichinella pseudospiralis TaxID=6337 RepID=A0A0V1IDW8_TRIPS|nr:hypothetical protein T4D_1727 [Trichinella pseudospiralis]KRZ20245.1 hypothetical protein T4B_8143 [Trichinella pseudospiralis]KRZ39072.1 hypothetical protein T4C_10887 [Trichinella pseudospiralis]